MNIQINVEIDKTATSDLVGMSSRFEVFFAVIPCTDTERLQAFNPERLLAVAYTEPTHIRPAAIVLRMDVFGLVLAERHHVMTNECTSLAVRIVLPRAATVIVDSGHI